MEVLKNVNGQTIFKITRKLRFVGIYKGDNVLNIGDYVAQINKDSSGVWKLYKDKINKITTTKKYGRRYFTKTVFRSLDADDVDNNTKDMEESIGK